MWSARLLLSRGGTWGLLSTCGVQFGSSLVAVLGASQVVVGVLGKGFARACLKVLFEGCLVNLL